jgi:hypothetical protein
MSNKEYLMPEDVEKLLRKELPFLFQPAEKIKLPDGQHSFRNVINQYVEKVLLPLSNRQELILQESRIFYLAVLKAIFETMQSFMRKLLESEYNEEFKHTLVRELDEWMGTFRLIFLAYFGGIEHGIQSQTGTPGLEQYVVNQPVKQRDSN